MNAPASYVRNESRSIFAPEIAGAISSGHEQIVFSPSETDCKTLTFSL